MIAPERAAALLDEVIYQRVVECIDLDRLYALEQSLAEAHSDQRLATERARARGPTPSPPAPDARIDEHLALSLDWAKTAIDRALARLPTDPRRYAPFGAPDPDGLDCALCAREAATDPRP